MSSTTQERQLQARYRRILQFGDVLDESIQLYRRHFLMFVLVSACAIIPPGLLAIAFSTAGAFDTQPLVADILAGRTPSVAAVGPQLANRAGVGVLQGLFYLAWAVAVVLTADAYLHGEQPGLMAIIRLTLRRYVAALLTGIVLFIALGLLLVLAVVPFIIPPIGLFGIVVALVGLLVWWLRPTARKTWLKWLIVVSTPFGLPLYFLILWSMQFTAVAIEGRWLIGALQRSAELVDRHWFRVMGTLLLTSIIVGLLQYVPTTLVLVPLLIVTASRGQVGFAGPELAISTAAALVVQILISSLSSIVYTVLFVDLRNRREGTDIAQRLSQLEAIAPTPAND